MKTVRALVLTGNGINCEREMAHACRLAGAEADVAHMAEVFAGRVALDRYHFLNLPGGFSDGDDLGSQPSIVVTSQRQDPEREGDGDHRHRTVGCHEPQVSSCRRPSHRGCDGQ